MSKTRERTEGVANSAFIGKRGFLKAAAAMGVVVAAGFTGKSITAAHKIPGGQDRMYADEALRQEMIMMQKELVIMSDQEKSQTLKKIMDNHRQEIS